MAQQARGSVVARPNWKLFDALGHHRVIQSESIIAGSAQTLSIHLPRYKLYWFRLQRSSTIAAQLSDPVTYHLTEHGQVSFLRSFDFIYLSVFIFVLL